MQASPAPPARSSRRAELAWTVVASLTAVVLFGVIFIGQMPKWPIYVAILMWWSFIVYTIVGINRQKTPPSLATSLPQVGLEFSVENSIPTEFSLDNKKAPPTLQQNKSVTGLCIAPTGPGILLSKLKSR